MSQSDEHYKTYLGRRYARVYWLLLGASAIVLIPTTGTALDGFGLGALALDLPAGIVVGVASIVTAIGVILPIFAQKVISVKATYNAPVPSKDVPESGIRSAVYPLSYLSERKSRAAALSILQKYLIAANVWTVVFVTGNRLRGGDELVDWGLTRGTYRYPYHLNEKSVYLYLAFVSFGICLGSSDIFRGKWKRPVQPSTKRSIKGIITICFLTSMRAASMHSIACFLVYRLTRRSAWSLLLTQTAGMLRPFIVHFTRPRTRVSVGLAFQAFFAEMTFAFLVKMTMHLFDAIVTMPFDFSPTAIKGAASADQYLVAALESKDEFMLTFTVNELVDVSFKPERRQVIFGDISTKPTPWERLCQNLLVQLDRSVKLVQTRDAGPVTTQQVRGAAESSVRTDAFATLPVEKPEHSIFLQPTPTPATRLEQTEIQLIAAADKTDEKVAQLAEQGKSLLPVIRSQISGLLEKAVRLAAFDQEPDQRPPVVKAITEAGNQAMVKADQTVKKVPHAERAIHTLQVASQQALAVEKEMEAVVKKIQEDPERSWSQAVLAQAGQVASKVPGLLKVMEGSMTVLQVAQDIAEPASAWEWAMAAIETALPRRRIDEGVIKVLSAYMAASYSEDAYGQVQRDIPTILSTYGTYHAQLRSLRTELVQLARSRDQRIRESRRASASPTEQPARGLNRDGDRDGSGAPTEQVEKKEDQRADGLDIRKWWETAVESVWKEEAQPLQQTMERSVSFISQVFGNDMRAFELSASAKSLLEFVAKGTNGTGE